MVHQLPSLQKRSDGWHETPSGDFAVVMRAMSAEYLDEYDRRIRWFEFVTGHGMEPLRVEWLADDRLQIFPGEVAAALVRQNFARFPLEPELEWYDERLVSSAQDPAPAPTPAPTPAPETSPEAPQNAPETAGKGGEGETPSEAPETPQTAPTDPTQDDAKDAETAEATEKGKKKAETGLKLDLTKKPDVPAG